MIEDPHQAIAYFLVVILLAGEAKNRVWLQDLQRRRNLDLWPQDYVN
jgi:hypothetical protein